MRYEMLFRFFDFLNSFKRFSTASYMTEVEVPAKIEQ